MVEKPHTREQDQHKHRTISQARQNIRARKFPTKQYKTHKHNIKTHGPLSCRGHAKRKSRTS